MSVMSGRSRARSGLLWMTAALGMGFPQLVPEPPNATWIPADWHEDTWPGGTWAELVLQLLLLQRGPVTPQSFLLWRRGCRGGNAGLV